jgi:probable addiction module antidote protein
MLADGDGGKSFQAISYVAEARGMAQMAKDSGMGRESLCKVFANKSAPLFFPPYSSKFLNMNRGR